MPKTDGVGDKNRPSLLDEPGCIDSEDPRPSYLSRLPTPIHQAVFEGVRISLKPSEGQASDLGRVLINRGWLAADNQYPVWSARRTQARLRDQSEKCQKQTRPDPIRQAEFALEGYGLVVSVRSGQPSSKVPGRGTHAAGSDVFNEGRYRAAQNQENRRVAATALSSEVRHITSMGSLPPRGRVK